MAITVTHAKVSAKPAGDDPTVIYGPDWNADHVITGLTAADVAGLAPSATTDTTNATNITSGTLPQAQLPAIPVANLPLPTATTVGVVKSLAAQPHQFLTQIGTDGSISQAQPAFTDISGNPSVSQLQPAAGTATPLIDGTAAVGTSTLWAHQDHVHPTDTTRAPVASPTFTGTPAAPTATVGTNTTQIATTAFVIANAGTLGNTTPNMDGTGAAGSAATAARSDHVHPTDTSRAPLASPALTGTPTAPTAAVGTNTTQVATTAFVAAAESRVLLNTLTASNSATLSDTTSLTSSFSEYEIVFENIVAATAGGQQLELQVHSGGAFQTTSYLTNMLHCGNGASSVTNPTTFIPLTAAGAVLSTGQGFSGTFRVSTPSGTTAPKNWYGQGTLNNGSVGFNEIGSGCWNGGNGAVDGFQVLFGTGNIASGTIKVYGLR